MKRVYTVLRPPIDQKSYAEWITKCDQKLSISSKGIVAFTSSFCLNQARPNSVSYHVYVADINAPYKPYLLVESEHEFTLIEWDPSGTKLLVCDARSCVTIFNSKDYLISDWKAYFKQVFAAESFLTACWYHSGIVSTINVANQNLKNSSNHLEYSDKIQQSKFGASLRLFGGKAAEGCLLISRTGLICCLTLMADGTVDVTSASLGPLRNRVEVADISYCKDGAFVVGTSTGSINSTISFYKIQLNIKTITLDEVDSIASNEGKRVNIICKQFNSFHLNVMSQILTERENTCTFERVNHIKFVSKESPCDVLIEVSGQNLSLIELWELEPKKKSPIHTAILELKGSNPNSNDNTLKAEENGATQQRGMSHDWLFKGNYITDKSLATIRVPRFGMFGSNRQLNIIILAHTDSTICCIRKEDLHPIGEPINLASESPARNLNGRPMDGDPKSPYRIYQNHGNIKHCSKALLSLRKQRLNFITDIQFSTNQTMFVAVDTMSQLHVVKLPTMIQCQDTQDEETYWQYLLEYCLVTGNDWWDVMCCARRNSIETICDKFHDAYERQPKHIQRKFFNRQLMIRASLYRCLNVAASLCKSSDCHSMIMLNSIASTLKSMLRSQDQDSPADHLSHFLKTQGAQPSFFNYANVISKINEKEFYVEVNLIQCLQPLNQWVVDFAIFLIASMPQRIRSRSMLPGGGLAQNKEALEIIRELLIIIKIWGTQNEACLPIVYQLNDQLDVLETLFRLISICYNSLGSEPEATFLDECIQFANNLSVTHFSFFLPSTGVASPLLHNRLNENVHLVLEFFQDPTQPEPVTLDKVEGSIDMNGNRKIDIVRNISLGTYPVTNVRHCTRCNSVSLNKPSFSTTRVWEQRWMTTCVCGGSWAQSGSLSVNKVSYLASLHHTTGAHNQVGAQVFR